jgi:heme oxygenase
VLNDIGHAGGDKEAARRSQPGFATEMMVAYAYDTVMRGNPAAFFGMVYVLEGTSISMATQCADAIAAQLNLPKKCFSYLSSHGSLDVKHMAFFEGLMNRITDPADQDAIIHMAKRMFVLFAGLFRSIPHEGGLRHAA